MSRNLRDVGVGCSLRPILTILRLQVNTRAEGVCPVAFWFVHEVSWLPGQVILSGPEGGWLHGKRFIPRWTVWARLVLPFRISELSPSCHAGLWFNTVILSGFSTGCLSKFHLRSLPKFHFTGDLSVSSSLSGLLSTGNPVQRPDSGWLPVSSPFFQWLSTSAWSPSFHDYAFPLLCQVGHGVCAWHMVLRSLSYSTGLCCWCLAW